MRQALAVVEMSGIGLFDGLEASGSEDLLEPSHASLKDLHAYWLSKKGARVAPPRSAILPEEIVVHLPHIALVDVMGDPPRFRFRLFGSSLVAAYGQDITGKFADEIDLGKTSVPEFFELALSVVREVSPRFGRTQFTKQGDRRRVEYERALLPLSNDGSTVSMILCGYAVEKAYG
jgi:hypothetical protein